MTRYARINDDGRVAELLDEDPAGRFHPDVVFVEIPDALGGLVTLDYIVADDTIQPPSLDYLRRQLEQRLADIRFRVETGGLTLGGQSINTDRESQSQLSNAYQALAQPLVSRVDWKGPDGWVTVTAEQLKPIAGAVAVHVQGCFTAERQTAEALFAERDLEALIEALPTLDLAAEFDSRLETAKAAAVA